MKCILTNNEQATIALAHNFAKTLRGGDILLLQGELGAGKTVFVKGLAQALGIKQTIKSPTFVLMRQHGIRNQELGIRNLIHIDAYRVKNPQELMSAGLAEWLGQKDTVTVIEWGEKIKPLLNGQKHITIKFKHGEKENERIIQLP